MLAVTLLAFYAAEKAAQRGRPVEIRVYFASKLSADRAAETIPQATNATKDVFDFEI